MDICLDELHRIDVALEGYTLLGVDSHLFDTIIVWNRKLPNGYMYRIKKYDKHHREIASCEFKKKIQYDTIRMYHNICILIQSSGDYEKCSHCKNVLMITADGLELKEFPIGKGIKDISISPQGTLWCVYNENGTYHEYVPVDDKKENSIIAGWNFFGELVYALDFPYSKNTNVFKNGCSICAQDNHHVYFFTNHLDLYEIQKMQICRSYVYTAKYPLKFIVKDSCIWIHYQNDLNNIIIEQYDFHNCEDKKINCINITKKSKKINPANVFMGHEIVWIKHEHYVYRYEI